MIFFELYISRFFAKLIKNLNVFKVFYSLWIDKIVQVVSLIAISIMYLTPVLPRYWKWIFTIKILTKHLSNLYLFNFPISLVFMKELNEHFSLSSQYLLGKVTWPSFFNFNSLIFLLFFACILRIFASCASCHSFRLFFFFLLLKFYFFLLFLLKRRTNLLK